MAYRERHRTNPLAPVDAFEARNMVFPAHWHEAAEIVLVLDGQMDFGLDGRAWSLGPGEAGIAAPGSIHSYNGPDSLCLIFIFPQLVSAPPALLSAGLPPLYSGILQRDASAYPALEAAATIALQTLGSLAVQGQPEKALVLMALTGILRGLLCPGHAGTKSRSNWNEASPGIRKALEYMERQFASPVSLSEAAEAAGLSPWYFSRQFSKQSGLGFNAWLNARRLAEAERLLADSDLSMMEIADEAGFGGIRSLDRAFKTYRGMNPRSYRRLATRDLPVLQAGGLRCFCGTAPRIPSRCLLPGGP